MVDRLVSRLKIVFLIALQHLFRYVVEVCEGPEVDVEQVVGRNPLHRRIKIRDVAEGVSQGVSKLTIAVDHTFEDFV